MTSLATAQEALASGSWSRAGSAFRVVLEQTGDPLALEGLAQVAWWTDDETTCLTAREKAYRSHRERADPVGAARSATALAWDSLLFGQGRSVALGWLGRAREMLADLAERPEHGWCLVREAELALALDADPARAREHAWGAAEVGRRTGDADLVVVGRALQGLALVRMGEVRAAMAKLDPAAAAATAGDVTDLMWMGKVLCWLIAACHETRDVTRAQEWCARVERVCQERDLAPLLHVCRIQYASVQVSAGDWAVAEKDLTETVGRLSGSGRASRWEAVVQLGELRRRQGRLEEAEALFDQAEFDPVAVLGRALIHHGMGQSSRAWSSLQRLLGTLPTDNRLARADVLLPAVRIGHAVGQDEAAARAADELRATAGTVQTEALLAMSALADSVLAEPAAAADQLHEAVRHYHRAGLRHDEAETRLLLASRLADQQDVAGAQEQLTAATATMTDLEDTVGLRRARQLQRALDGRSTTVLTPREIEVLRLVSRGLSNGQVAQALVLSPHTVHRHVANILTKLGQPTRAAAASHALTARII